MNTLTINQYYVDQHKETVGEVFAKDYYVDIFMNILKYKKYTLEKVLQMTDSEEICSFWNSFWFALPDNKNIRRQPFFKVCDLAESEG